MFSNQSRTTFKGLFLLLVVLPLIFLAAEFVMLGLLHGGGIGGGAVFLCFLIFCAWRGARFAWRNQVDHVELGAFERHRPVILAFAYTLTVATIVVALPVPEEGGAFSMFNFIFGCLHPFSSFPVAVAFIGSGAPPWLYLLVPLGIYTFFGLGMAYGYRSLGATRRDWAICSTVALLLFFMGGVVAWRFMAIRSRVLPSIPYSEWSKGKRVELANYRPLREGNRLVKIADPTLQIASEYPRLDGSTAVFPVYAAAAQALYTQADGKVFATRVTSTKTPSAYKKLVAGEVDLIMATPPSPAQRAMAEEAGNPLQMTPVAREAFVFFVHKDNPVAGLTTSQLQAIYRKDVTNWKELGGAFSGILPFQRPNGSGSQTAFLRHVMAGTKPIEPLQEELATGMGGIIRKVASYRNSTRAIGYSFRYYMSTMDGNPEVKMLAIDGVEPTPANIRNGIYPFVTDIYLVTAGTKNPHVPELIKWFQSPQGQALIEEVGYVGRK